MWLSTFYALFCSAHGAHISNNQDDSPLVASYNFNVMPPHGDNPRLHDDIDELRASLAAVNRSLQAAPNADTVTDIQAAMTEMNNRLTSLGQRADELQSHAHAQVNDTSDNADVTLTYERWGRTECPDDTGATLVYAGTYM